MQSQEPIDHTMSAEEFKSARLNLGFTQHTWGLLIGYNDRKYLRNHINQIESGVKPVRKVQALLIKAYINGYRPNDWPSKDF